MESTCCACAAACMPEKRSPTVAVQKSWRFSAKSKQMKKITKRLKIYPTLKHIHCKCLCILVLTITVYTIFRQQATKHHLEYEKTSDHIYQRIAAVCEKDNQTDLS